MERIGGNIRGIIFCAGLGHRLLPVTNNIPKPMLRVAGKPVLEHLLDHLKKYAITEIIVNIHYKPEIIYKYFGTQVLYFYEPQLLGEEKTMEVLRPWLDKRFIAMNGDTLTDIDIAGLGSTATNVKAMDNGVYTGTMIVGPGQQRYYTRKHYWRDIGTFQGLQRARREYAKS